MGSHIPALISVDGKVSRVRVRKVPGDSDHDGRVRRIASRVVSQNLRHFAMRWGYGWNIYRTPGSVVPIMKGLTEA